MDIQGILFDSGNTLVFPKSGSWWPGADFTSILLRHDFSSNFSTKVMGEALEAGQQYLNSNHHVIDLEEEKEQFKTYYRIICNNLGIRENDSLIEELACAYVEKCNFSLYPDTIPVLNTLTENGIILGIVSDAWPSLDNKYRSLGIRHYFKSFTISSVVGCCKPNELIYRKAIEEIGINPENLLFVDDDIENVKAAMRMGMNGLVMQRTQYSDIGSVPSVREFADVAFYIET